MFAVTGILIVALSGCLSFKLTENSAAEIAMGMENDKGGGLGVVGAQDPIKFLLLKVAQLETVTEMQQAEIESLKARGSEESVQTRQAEATSIMKKVWRKHEHQRRTGDFREGPADSLEPEGKMNATAAPKVESANSQLAEHAVSAVQKSAAGIFDVNAGKLRIPGSILGVGLPTIDLPSGFKGAMVLGKELSTCAGTDIVKCLGEKIIKQTPPFNFLTQMDDILDEVLEGFVRVANGVARQVLTSSSSLIQEAALSKFPAAGAPAAVHHSSQSLVITTHSQKSQLKVSTLQKTGPEHKGFSLHNEDGNYQSKLITQFEGYERDTGSCLAFAPSQRQIAGQVKAADWKVSNPNDFVQLEPWAVPCGTDWMKQNENKWQGYSFYTGELAIEQCLTVTYGLKLQPVFAFVGGVQIGVMPEPLVSVEATVCWPKQRPDGQDLSMVRLQIKSSSVLLFSRTVRLAKRYRDPVDWFDHAGHLRYSKADWQEAENPRQANDRTNLVQTGHNETQQAHDKAAKGKSQDEMDHSAFEWTEDGDIYLASGKYSAELGVNLTSEMRGMEAKKRLSLSAMGTQAFQLFSLKQEGKVNFEISSELKVSAVQMRTKFGFGPFSSHAKTITVVDIADQLGFVLHALPFMSSLSRQNAVDALFDFSTKASSLPALKPGVNVALHSAVWNQYLIVKSDGQVGGSSARSFSDGLPSGEAHFGRWTVVDAGHGQIAVHNSRFNAFLSLTADSVFVSYAAPKDYKVGWAHQAFREVVLDDGNIGLQNPITNRFVSMGNTQNTYVSSPSTDLPLGWTHQQFRVQILPALLTPGTSVGFKNKDCLRFLKMNNVGGFDGTDIFGSWERFLVVDAGSGEVALYNEHFRNMVEMKDDGSGIKPSSEIAPANMHDSTSLTPLRRFQVVPLKDGTIGLHNAAKSGFIYMTYSGGGWVDYTVGVSSYAIKDFPETSTAERWKVEVV